MNIFVAQLPGTVNGVILESLFAKYGEVESTRVIYDRVTGQSKKYGFVSMPNDDEAEKAIAALNEFELEGKTLVVKKADPPNKGFRIRM